jgi:hypothetical protein
MSGDWIDQTEIYSSGNQRSPSGLGKAAQERDQRRLIMGAGLFVDVLGCRRRDRVAAVDFRNTIREGAVDLNQLPIVQPVILVMLVTILRPGMAIMAKKAARRNRRHEIVARAIVDPAFRKTLFSSPEKVFGKKLSKSDAVGLARIKKMIPGLADVVGSLASNVLCNGGGGGCGSSVVVVAAAKRPSRR